MTKQPQMPLSEKKMLLWPWDWLWDGYIFSILALHTKYEPCKPSRTLSNRLLNDKTASNGLKNSLKIMFEASTDLNFFSQFWPQKHAHKNRGVKRASHVKFELNLCPHTASEPSVRFTSMNPACGVENIKLYYINNKKCHFSKWIGVI